MPRKYRPRSINDPCFWCGDTLNKGDRAVDRYGNRIHGHCLQTVEANAWDLHPLYRTAELEIFHR